MTTTAGTFDTSVEIALGNGSIMDPVTRTSFDNHFDGPGGVVLSDQRYRKFFLVTGESPEWYPELSLNGYGSVWAAVILDTFERGLIGYNVVDAELADDCWVEFGVIPSGYMAAGVQVRMSSADPGDDPAAYGYRIKARGNGLEIDPMIRLYSGFNTTLASSDPLEWPLGTERTVRVECSGDTITVLVDGDVVITYTEATGRGAYHAVFIDDDNTAVKTTQVTRHAGGPLD